MTVRSILLVALVAGAIMRTSIAHESPTSDYRAVQFYCYDMPLVLRKQARNQQYFHFSNIGFHDLYYIIFPDVFGETLDGNIVPDIKEGLIPEGKTIILTNTQMQLRNVGIAQEEGAEICFTPVTESGEYDWRFEPNGRVSVREIRRAAAGWISFTIPKGATWWTVRRRQSASLTSSDAESLSAQRQQSRQ